jgi:hypothetical protein
MTAKVVAQMLVAVGLLSTMLPAGVWGNHRAGSIALLEATVAGDFNEDGHVDVAVIATGFDQVAILLGNGHGTLTLHGLLPVDTLPKDIQVADINADGHQDLVVSNTWGYNIQLFLGDGQGGFSRVDELDADEPLGMTVADFKEDGHLDIAVATQGKEVLVFASSTKGRFRIPPVSVAAQKPFSLTHGDFNNDGHVDMAVTDRGSDTVFALLGDGAGGFRKTAKVALSDRPGRLAAGDLDENGTLDLVVAGGLPENADGIFLAILLGDGAGNFALTHNLNFGPGELEGQVIIEDFNEDGHLDVAVAPGKDGEAPLSEVWVLLGNGGGDLGPITKFPVAQEPHGIAVADLNEDGHQDMVVSNRAVGTVSVLLGNGAGGFALAGTFAVLP